MNNAKKQKYYAVRRGRKTGVFLSWPECQQQIFKYPGAEYKAFLTSKEAEDYVSGNLNAQTPLTETATNDPIVDIWVDGSCMLQPDGSLRLGWAYLALQAEQEIHRDRGNDIPLSAHQHRNVAGEIMAVLKAIAWCQNQDIRNIRIHHDYQGLASWPTHAWKRNTTFTQDYAEAVRKSGIAIQWIKVKAHSGDPNNEIVDQEAKQAAKAPAANI